MQPYYFDVLPLHPQPEHLESLTSYLMRLAEANEIPTLFRFQPIILPSDPNHGDSMRQMKDFYLHTFAFLAKASFCSETALQATTFFYLARKFGRLTKPASASHFLKGSLAESFRYCPLCLQTDSPYYILPWRFLMLTGCPYHGCRLLDRCSFCGRTIPLLTNILKVNICPYCRAAFSDSQVEQMDDTEHRQAQTRFQDLTFLLLPSEHEVEPGAVGPRLAYWRKARQLESNVIAEHLGETLRTARSLERRAPKRGLKFQKYLAYVDYLGVTFEELFNTILTSKEEGYSQYLSPEQRFQHKEEELLQQIHQVVEDIQAQGDRLSHQAVSAAVALTRSSLRHYPRIRDALTQISQDRQQQALLRKQQKEQEWVDKVNQAIDSLRAEGKPVSQVTIGRLLNRHRRGFGHYPRVKAIMTTVAEDYRQRVPRRREETVQKLIADIQEAIAELESQGKQVTKLTVAKMIGVSKGLINYYPEIMTFFEQYAEWTGKPPRKGKQ